MNRGAFLVTIIDTPISAAATTTMPAVHTPMVRVKRVCLISGAT